MVGVSIIGIDLAKRSFQLNGARADGSVAYRRKLSRRKLLGLSRLAAALARRRWRRARAPTTGAGRSWRSATR